MSADDNGEFRVIRASTSSNFAEVRLYDETLSEHIPEHHPEIKLAGTALGAILMADAIEEAVTNPTKIHESASSPGSQVFTCNRVTHQGNPIVVPVRKLAGSTSGRVTTAYFADNEYPGTLIWSAENE
jgi:hypothetical protein